MRRFGRDEDGGIILFSLYLFVMMMLIGGLAVDMMRYEVTRVRLQATLDRAILAAADLEQTLPPSEVVADYFDKAGLTQYLSDPVRVTEGLNFRIVQAEANATVPMMFMDMFNPIFPFLDGIETMDATTNGTATESVEDIEISLVLDISGSMRGQKLEDLQQAAKDFVEIIYQNNDFEDISINIIPYSTQVGVGRDILSEFNVRWYHAYTACVDFELTHFDEPGISRTSLLHQTPHISPWYHWGPLANNDDPELHQCRKGTNTEILPFSNNPAALNAHIDGLTAGGNTSIEIGVKWATAMLDPSFQPVVTHLIQEDIVSSDFAGRPYTTQSGASMKVMLVMTDGANTTEFRVPNHIRTGMSDVWFDPVCGDYYIDSNESGDRDSDGDWNERFYLPHRHTGNWNDRHQFWRDNHEGIDCHTRTGRITDDAVRLSHMDLYDRVSMHYNAQEHWRHQHGSWDDYRDHFTYLLDDTIADGEKDHRMDMICDTAKSHHIQIYTIGFEVEDHAAGVMEDCASAPALFYRVADGDALRDAFQAIARQVNALRLVQ